MRAYQVDRDANPDPIFSRRRLLATAAGLTFAVSLRGVDAIAAATADGPLGTAWVTIQPDGVIRIMSAATDFGQGSMTSLPLIFADEMDADWSKVRVELSPPDEKLYGNPGFGGIMYTAGSNAVQSYFKPLRMQAAQVRRVLLDSVAARWGVPWSQLRTEPSVVVDKVSGRKISYGEIAAFARVPSKLPEITESDLKPFSEFRYIGKDVMRIEIPSKVDGSAQYAIDVQLPNMLYGAILRAPIEGSAPQTVDGKAALKVRGVVKIVRLPYGVGVLASTAEAAFSAKENLKVSWTKTTSDSFNSDQAIDRYAAAAKNLGTEGKIWDKDGDVDAAFSRAKIILESAYRTDYVYHGQMEPLNAVASVDQKGEGAEIWVGTQAPGYAVKAAAQALGSSPEKIKLHRVMTGGAFGRRGHSDQDFLVDAVLLSKDVKRPVKVIWTREDDVHNGRFKPMTAHFLRAGLDENGNLIAWRHRLSSDEALAFQDPARFKFFGEKAILALLGAEQPAYDLPNRLIDHVRQEDGVRLSSMRGVGNPPNAFATESFMDEIARKLNKDPFEFRMELLRKSPRGQAVLKAVADMSDWKRGRRDGQGLGVCFRDEGGTLVAMIAAVSVDRKSGEIKVHNVWTAADVGLAVQPDNIAAQLEGAITYTLGAALFERITIKDGQVEQSNFYDYRVPRITDLPDIEVKVLPTDNPPTGIGEMGGNVTGAIANAVADAIGVRVRQMPMTPDRVLAAIGSSSGK